MPEGKEVLQTFYNRMMPMYRPQAEKFVSTVEPAIFSEVSFRYTFSVEAMTKVSHIIEDAAMSNPGVADFHVSFQILSRLQPQAAQYKSLATYVRKLWVYGETDISTAEMKFLSQSVVINTANTLLSRYWFVVAYGPGIGMTLLAEEIPALSGKDRYYEGFYTFEEGVAYQVISILNRIYPGQVPAPIPPEQFEKGNGTTTTG